MLRLNYLQLQVCKSKTVTIVIVCDESSVLAKHAIVTVF